MDYGALIREAWTTTWRHRFLWILGLFAGGAAGLAWGGGRGPGVQWRTQNHDMERFGPAAGRVAEVVGSWMAANAGLVVAVAVAAALLGLLALVVSLVAQGGMAEATVDLASGRSSSLGRAWRTGLRLFWRYAGLWLLLIALGIAIAAVIGALVALLAGLASFGGVAAPVAVLVGLLIGAPLVLMGIVFVVAMSIVVAYAQRAIFAEDAGPVAALRSGWRLLRAHPGASALAWLVNLALGIGAGIVTALALLMVFAVLGGIGAAVWAVAGFSIPTIAYGALGLLVVIVAGAILTAIANTFFWNYWTLAYLRLTGRPDAMPTGV
ncbi:MAG: DUF7544 domain-containing protein [Chloroflexota bacterium]